MHYAFNLEKPAFTVESIHVLNVIRDRGYTYSYRNGRTKHGFVYIVSGSMDYRFLPEGSDPIRLCKDELIFVPQGSAYTSTYLEDHTQIRLVQFELASGSLPSYLRKPGKLLLPDAAKLIGAFFRPSHSHPFYSLSCFYELLWQIDESCVRIPSRYKKLLTALQDLSANYKENRPISYYAALCGMSEPNFRRLFRAYTGQSPVDYRNALRLSDARVKLQSGEYNVSEAAETSGFSNLSFFIRLYKKKYGYTPKKE